MKHLLSVFVIVLHFLACTALAFAGEVRIASGYTFIKRVFEPVRADFKAKTGLELKIIYADPLPAITALNGGNVDVAGASFSLETWLELAKRAGIPVGTLADYSSQVVTTEKTHFVVNKANKVQTLSREQLKGIFTGTITNWKELGGDDAPVLVVWPTASSGALVMVKQKILDNEPLSKTVYDVETIGDVPEAIAVTPEAVGIVTGAILEKGLKEIAPPIERPLTLLYKGKATSDLQKMLDYLKREGKQYVQ